MGIFKFRALLLLSALAFATGQEAIVFDTFDYRPSNIVFCFKNETVEGFDVVVQCVAGNNFSPPNWPTLFPEFCGGSAQSPINIERKRVVKTRESPFVFTDYDTASGPVTLVNTGFQASLELDNHDPVPTLSGGGLDFTYKFAAFHFHWGSNDLQGSEHAVNGLRFPLEMHMIHFNSEKFDTEEDAIASGEPDALVVLATLFNIADEDHPAFEPIIDALENIILDGQETEIEGGAFQLADLLPSTDRFYRYAGSLTTPTCNEVVSWTVFRDTVDISTNQLEAFRALTFDFKPEAIGFGPIAGVEENLRLVDIYRPTQALNGRVVSDVTTKAWYWWGNNFFNGRGNQ